MNQRAYKIKFGRRLGTWMAVSELTRGASKGSGGTPGDWAPGEAVRAGAMSGLQTCHTPSNG
ncbi:ESPR domain-containing protein [Burkholderia ubonensis]|uniref:ESPR domain-containing protein n=1 Tax=Burkholderia ubonensis TaxID=101571 RepID=UPI00075CD70D